MFPDKSQTRIKSAENPCAKRPKNKPEISFLNYLKIYKKCGIIKLMKYAQKVDYTLLTGPRKEVITVSGKEINELIQTGEFAKIDPAEAPVKELISEPELPEELLEAAEAHADKQLDDIREEKHKRKKALIKLGIMLAPTAIVLIFASI